MKNFFIVFLLGISVLYGIAYISKAHAASSTIFSISPSSDTKQVDEVFNSTVAVETGQNKLVSADLVIQFNPEEMEVLDIVLGSFLDGAQVIKETINNSSGNVIFSFYTSKEQAKSGNGTVASILWKGKKAGSSTVSFNSSDTLAYGLLEGSVLLAVNGASFTFQQNQNSSTAPTSPPSGSGNSSSSSTSSGAGKQGDLNGDSRVDVTDLSILLRNWSY